MVSIRAGALALVLACGMVTSVAAWNDHTRVSSAALGTMTELESMVEPESLEDFLQATKEHLPGRLASIEAEARAGIPSYRPLPPELAYRPEVAHGGLAAAFLSAVRVNPAMKVALSGGPGPLPALDVLVAASDEPDYGMDVGLYEDNPGPLGGNYGFGRQPFGNPALDYGSQAPFHMAFAHEDPLVKLLAPFTQESMVAYRVMLWVNLARFAHAEGHAYWGWRFGGWALHYVQDMAQPYHASLLPGLDAAQILLLNAFGAKADKDAALVFLSNRHLIYEDFLYGALGEGADDRGLRAALAGSADSPDLPPWRTGYEIDVVGLRAYGRGKILDSLITGSFPARYVADPSYDLGAMNVGAGREYEAWDDLNRDAPEAAGALIEASRPIFADLGEASRALVRSLLDGSNALLPRNPEFDPRWAGLVLVNLLIMGLVAAGVLILVRRRKRKTR